MRGFDLALRAAGGALAILLGAGSAVLQVMATPGLWLVPVLTAGVGNLFLAWFVRSTVERSWAWLLPAVPWCVIMAAAIGGTAEGDQLANSWTGLGTFAAGGFAIVAAVAWRPGHRAPAVHPLESSPESVS